MAILARIITFILWLILATWLGRKLLGWLSGGASQPDSRSSSRGSRRLQRDPWCGTYVSPDISHTLEHDGQVQHFCSAECRDRFLSEERHAGRIRASA